MSADASHRLQLVGHFITAHPAEAGRILEGFPPSQAGRFLEEVSPEVAAAAVAHMGPNAAANCLSAVTVSTARNIVSSVPATAAAALLRHLSPETQQAIVDLLEPRVAKAVRQLLQYPAGTAGALADPLVVALPSDLTLGEAQRQVGRSPEGLLYHIFVVDREHRLVGMLDVRELFLASRNEKLATVMHPQVVALDDWMGVAGIAVHPGWRDYDALPVVDRRGVFLGAVRYRTLRGLAESREETRGASLLATLFSLGELYWASMAAVLTSVVVAPGTSHRPASMGDTND
jgi:magnesium transporter